jgi:hypothetical protein
MRILFESVLQHCRSSAQYDLEEGGEGSTKRTSYHR